MEWNICDTISRTVAIEMVKEMAAAAWNNWHEPTLTPESVINGLEHMPAAQFQRVTVDGVTLYRCDPAKNTACSKTGCFADGGQCYLTKHKDFEKTEESAE